MKHTSVQAQEISYELNTLGWKSFQDLCVTIISDVLGQTVQSFSSIKDGGRDGAFHGTWKSKADVDMDGAFTVQCKFTSSRDKSITLSSLKDELKKARRLARNELSDAYILMTNYGVSGSTDEKIRKAFLSIPKINNFVLFGRECAYPGGNPGTDWCIGCVSCGSGSAVDSGPSDGTSRVGVSD